MCDCRDEDGDPDAPPAGVPIDRLVARTRAVERRRPGEPVPEALWPVFFGESSGTIPWRHHARMVACREIALAMVRLARPADDRAACFRCEP